MKTVLKIEEVSMLLLVIFLFAQLPFQWWWFLVLFLAPDLGIAGYLINNKVGAFSYNFFHHKGVVIAAYLLGYYLANDVFMLIGVIVFSHTAFDRVLGYGLKFATGFKYTHLGEIGKDNGNYF